MIINNSINGFGIGEDGRMLHLSQFFIMRMNQLLTGRDNDVLGNSRESAIGAVSEALYSLNNPLAPYSADVIEHKNKEREFYEAFLRNLNE